MRFWPARNAKGRWPRCGHWLKPCLPAMLRGEWARRMGAVNFRGGYIDGEVIDDVPGEVVAEQV